MACKQINSFIKQKRELRFPFLLKSNCLMETIKAGFPLLITSMGRGFLFSVLNFLISFKLKLLVIISFV